MLKCFQVHLQIYTRNSFNMAFIAVISIDWLSHRSIVLGDLPVMPGSIFLLPGLAADRWLTDST